MRVRQAMLESLKHSTLSQLFFIASAFRSRLQFNFAAALVFIFGPSELFHPPRLGEETHKTHRQPPPE